MPMPPEDQGIPSREPRALDEARTAWLTALYEGNARMVFTTCRRMLHNVEDADDATHEVFLRAASSLHVAPDSQDARAWLTTVARNYCLDVLRRQRRYQSALTTLGPDDTQVESETVVVDRHLAQAVLDQLAVRDRQALWESHVEERPIGEIAARLGLSYRATAQLLSRARRRAALVVAELAALLALFRIGLRRGRAAIQNVAAHPVAAIVFVPLVATALISTGSSLPAGNIATAAAAILHPTPVLRSRALAHVAGGPVQTMPPAGLIARVPVAPPSSLLVVGPSAHPGPLTPIAIQHDRGRHKGRDHDDSASPSSMKR